MNFQNCPFKIQQKTFILVFSFFLANHSLLIPESKQFVLPKKQCSLKFYWGFLPIESSLYAFKKESFFFYLTNNPELSQAKILSSDHLTDFLLKAIRRYRQKNLSQNAFRQEIIANHCPIQNYQQNLNYTLRKLSQQPSVQNPVESSISYNIFIINQNLLEKLHKKCQLNSCPFLHRKSSLRKQNITQNLFQLKTRLRLIELVTKQKRSIKKSCQNLNVNYSTGKLIIKKYLQTGGVTKFSYQKDPSVEITQFNKQQPNLEVQNPDQNSNRTEYFYLSNDFLTNYQNQLNFWAECQSWNHELATNNNLSYDFWTWNSANFLYFGLQE